MISDKHGFVGLSATEAQRRLKDEGYNELPREKQRRFFKVALDVLKEPMLVMLLICTAIYFFLGDVQEAFVLLASVVIVIVITVYQENKTEKAIAALKSLASPRALVLRDNNYQRVPGREVVRGDIVFLNEGDRVPADGILLWNNNLNINESLLTGESLAVTKTSGGSETPLPRPGDSPAIGVYSGTLIVSGQGLALIKAVGKNTEMGRIGALLEEIKEEKTPLQKSFARAVKIIFSVGIILCCIIIILTGFFSGDWLAGVLSGITLAMAIFPEEFPVVLAVFTAIGAWRLSKNSILVRQMNAVENLGAATVLCVDKTGTLTMNEMRVSKIFSADRLQAAAERLSDSNRETLRIGALASRRETFDPLEKAIRDARRHVYKGENIYAGLIYKKEYPLTDKLLAVAHVWENEKEILAAAKGAPEAVMVLCGLSAAEKESLEIQVKELAGSGLRVLGVARADFSSDSLPDNIQGFNWRFLGLLGFMDPVRPGAAQAVKECYEAGIDIKMITGDYSETGLNIARQISLRNNRQALMGIQLADFSPAILAQEVDRTDVFARMVPEDKLRIIRALKDKGHIVVMTGDGVNDGPALKAADIGVAMGSRGTDVAREAAGIILLDDDFSSLVKGVKEGRRIFANLKKTTTYLVAVHIPIAGLSFLPLLFGWPPLFFPVHIMFLELVVDPICSVVFEAEPADRDIMKRPPRAAKETILNRRSFLLALGQGLTILAVCTAVYVYGFISGWEQITVRALTFATLIFSNLFLVIVNRSWLMNFFQAIVKKNHVLWPVMLFSLLFLGAALYIPALRNIFQFSALSGWELGTVFGIAFLPAFILEIVKLVRKIFFVHN